MAIACIGELAATAKSSTQINSCATKKFESSSSVADSPFVYVGPMDSLRH
nr:hypothetical protein Itr_chr03CG03220 [Ipomoea trifida]